MVLHSITFSRSLTKSAAKNNDFVFQSAFCTDRLFSYLCHSFGFAAPNCYGSAIKRESGANPEQTRCCKFLPKSLNTSQATVRHRMGRHSKTEQVRRPAKKTNTVLMLSGNKAVKHRVWSFFIPFYIKKSFLLVRIPISKS